MVSPLSRGGATCPRTHRWQVQDWLRAAGPAVTHSPPQHPVAGPEPPPRTQGLVKSPVRPRCAQMTQALSVKFLAPSLASLCCRMVISLIFPPDPEPPRGGGPQAAAQLLQPGGGCGGPWPKSKATPGSHQTAYSGTRAHRLGTDNAHPRLGRASLGGHTLSPPLAPPAWSALSLMGCDSCN